MMRIVKPVLILDVDGVLLKWESCLPLFLMDLGIDRSEALKAYSSPVHVSAQNLFGMKDNELALTMVRKYHLSEYGSRFPAFGDAVEVIPKLAEKYDLIALSCFGDGIDYWANRRRNLEAFFPGCFQEFISIDLMECKIPVVQKLATEYDVVAFIDDQDKYLDAVRQETSVKTIKLNRNTSDTHFPDFHELLKGLQDEKGIHNSSV